MKLNLTLSIVFFALHHAMCTALSPRPLIGILTEPHPTLVPKELRIVASYVKFVESAGARVVPVPHTHSEEQLMILFESLNGILLPGGDTPFDPSKPFFQAALTLGKFLDLHPTFPVFGTCLGFELIACVAAKEPKLVVGRIKSANLSLPLHFIADPKESRLFEFFSDKLLTAVQTEALTYNKHVHALNLSVFTDVPAIRDNFRPLGVNYDANDVQFVSAFESLAEGKWKNVFGVQFHPEKSVFEWKMSTHVNHSLFSTQMSQNLAHAFIHSARAYSPPMPLPESAILALMIQGQMQHHFLGNSYFQETYTRPMV